MSKKLTELTVITEIKDEALFYVVDTTRTAGDQSTGATKETVGNSLGPATGIPTVVSAIWTGTGLEFFVTADALYLDDVLHSGTADNVTLDAADPTLDRLDFFGFYASTGLVGKATGTPASSSLVVSPDYNASDFYPIKLVLVKAGETTPSDPNTGDPSTGDLIFNEDTGSPGEWDLTFASSNLAVTSTDPYDGTESIEGTNCDLGDIMIFTSDTTMHTDDLSAITWWTKLKSDFGNQSIVVSFFNGSKRLGQQTYFNTGSNGFDGSNLGYQKITINRDDFTRLKSGSYTSIRIYYHTLTFDGWFFDLFELHAGSTPLPPIGGGGGDVVGTASSVDEDIAVFDGTTGKVIKDSEVNISEVALKANVLELDNTDVFTPDADYEPATKKYVDDTAGGSSTPPYEFAFSDEATAFEVGVVYTKTALRALASLDKVSIGVTVAPTGAKLEFDFKINGVSAFTTKPTIDIGEFSTDTAAIPQVLDGAQAIALGDVVELSITIIGSTIAGSGGQCAVFNN